MTVKEIIKLLTQDGWQKVEARTKGSHIQLKHPTKPGKVTVPSHKGDIAPGTPKQHFKASWIKIVS